MWNSKRAIIHLDMDAYFASVEQQINPLLKGKPVIVAGRGRRTVITTASYEARKYGIKSGMTVFQARRLCPKVAIVIADLAKYIYTTLEIRDILVSFTDRVELYSIDEFFLDVTNSQPIFGSPETIARKIKDKVQEETRLTCSCGLSVNKLIAKLGSKMNKPDGLTVIYPEQVAEILKDLPLDKLHGIGEKTRNYLNYLGVTKAGELGQTPISLLTSHFGLGGYILQAMGSGIDNAPVPYYWQQDEIKSISHTYTLPFDTSNVCIIRAYILMLCQRVVARLHERSKSAKTVALIIRHSDFETFSRRKTVGYFVDTIHGVYQICMKILADIGELRKPVRLLGVAVSGLADESGQLCLLETLERERELSRAVEKINNQYGEFTIKPASVMFAERFESLNGNEGWASNLNRPI